MNKEVNNDCRRFRDDTCLGAACHKYKTCKIMNPEVEK